MESLMLFSIVCGFFFLEETHPDMQPWSTEDDLQHTEAETPLFAAQAGTTTAAVDLRNESYGTFNKVVQDQEWNVLPDGTDAPKEAEPQNQVVFTKRVVMLIIALGIFTYHSMSYDHLLPIFFQDSRVESRAHGNKMNSMAGGLGLSIQDVGVVMSVNGLIALGVQAIIFPLAAAWLGVWKLFIVTTVLHPIAYVVVPYLVLLPEEWLYPGIYACLTIRNIFAILVYPVILILLKEAAPAPSCLGKINGLAASTGAACRTLASPIAGILYGIGIEIDFTALAWWVSGAVAILGAIQVFFINRKKSSEWHQVRARAPCRFMPPEEHRQEIVHIVVQDEEEQELEADEQRRLLA
ncbi:MFS general substrate transporter [Aureobasidium pullulans]|uniref:MFS general substrate transporter n=1 Tax=Aureobasidium pullulans TaxID=5580 RepID=A0A4S9KYX3_AURPU|nr:MFS general substrate transporter [Aureobasidium pullulans]